MSNDEVESREERDRGRGRQVHVFTRERKGKTGFCSYLNPFVLILMAVSSVLL